MSRVAKKPISIPSGVDVRMDGNNVIVKGAKGQLQHSVHRDIAVAQENGALQVTVTREGSETNALAGTTRALLNNMVTGVTAGFERKLTLVGVGYRAQVQGKVLNLTLGFSHPVAYPIPAGITIETPSQTEIVVKGIDKQQLGQVAAEIRAYRPPEPYKGKGVRYADEQIVLKEAKKK
jgi:large subunit ribosomal protein L6